MALPCILRGNNYGRWNTSNSNYDRTLAGTASSICKEGSVEPKTYIQVEPLVLMPMAHQEQSMGASPVSDINTVAPGLAGFDSTTGSSNAGYVWICYGQ